MFNQLDVFAFQGISLAVFVISVPIFFIDTSPTVAEHTIDFINSNIEFDEVFLYEFDLTQFLELDPSNKESVIQFITINYLDPVFNFNSNEIKKHYNTIIKDENFFKLIKSILGNQTTAEDLRLGVSGRNLKRKLTIFHYNLQQCNNIEDFKNIEKSFEVIKQVIFFVKSIYY